MSDSGDSTNNRDIDWQADINEPVPGTPSAVVCVCVWGGGGVAERSRGRGRVWGRGRGVEIQTGLLFSKLVTSLEAIHRIY